MRRAAFVRSLLLTVLAAGCLVGEAQASDGAWTAHDTVSCDFAVEHRLPVYGRSLVGDSRRHRAIEFGGAADPEWCSYHCWYYPRAFNDLVASDAAGRLAKLPAAGPIPAPRFQAAFAYDSLMDQVYVFGGDSLTVSYGYFEPIVAHSVRNDLWRGDLSSDPVRWDSIPATGTIPTLRSHSVMIVDPPRRRLVLFGGQDTLGNVDRHVYTLALDGPPVWSPRSPAGVPPDVPAQPYNSIGAFAAFDPRHDQMQVLVGGTLWSLDLAGPIAWRHATIAGTPPGGAVCGMTLDPKRNRLIVVTTTREFAAVALVDPPQWTPLVMDGSPSEPGSTAWSLPGLVYDAELDGVVLAYAAAPSLCWQGRLAWASARFAEVVASVEPAPGGLVLASPGNPLRGTQARIDCRLPRDAPASLALFDVFGRVLARDELRGTGTHTWHPSMQGRGAGIYFVRLRQGGESLTRRFVYAP